MSITKDEPSVRKDHGESHEKHEELPILPGDTSFDRKWDRGADSELPGEVRDDQDLPIHVED